LRVIEELVKSGAAVKAVQADVASASDVTKVLSGVPAKAPLRGVVHAAGVLDDGMLFQQTLERFHKVMKPKVLGAWNIHRMTRDVPLDFFVCFSSIASTLGNAGQGNYAASNAVLDALAHWRHAQGMRGLSVNWGPWGGSGMAADGRTAGHLASQGFEVIPAEGGVAALGLLLKSGTAQATVLA
jgi:myxalamid-type polyketide synthase MxaB